MQGKKGGLAIGNFPHVLMEKQEKNTRLQIKRLFSYLTAGRRHATPYVVSQFIAGPRTPIVISKTATSIICYYLIIVLILIII